MNIDRRIMEILRVKGHVGACPWIGWNKEFSRDDLAGFFSEVGYRIGAEVGVRQGVYSRTLCDKIPGLKLYCIDPWVPYSTQKLTQETQDRYYEQTKQRLSGFDVTLLRKTSMEALNDISDGALDFVYIDALHDFDSVMMDIICWSKKVRTGGIVSGHDYWRSDNCGVIEAANAYTLAHHIHPWFLTNNRGTTRGTFSFFWVKK